MDLEAYKKKVGEWKEKYKRDNDKRKLKDIKSYCEKCGNNGYLTRHHKGCEFFFATLYPAKYAKIYIRFRVRDTVYLCDICHLEIHQRYNRILKPFKRLVRRMKHTRVLAEIYRLKCVRECEKWLRR